LHVFSTVIGTCDHLDFGHKCGNAHHIGIRDSNEGHMGTVDAAVLTAV
jgi:hypothetical protein